MSTWNTSDTGTILLPGVAGRATADNGRRTKMGDAKRKGLGKLQEAIQLLRELDAEMPAQTAVTFLIVAQEPGISMAELTDRLKIAQSSTSRNVAYLSRWRAYEKPGHNLVEARENPQDRRAKVVELTSKGEKLAEALVKAVS
jgi:DNA-binding MarR family transcriptional regulator